MRSSSCNEYVLVFVGVECIKMSHQSHSISIHLSLSWSLSWSLLIENDISCFTGINVIYICFFPLCQTLPSPISSLKCVSTPSWYRFNFTADMSPLFIILLLVDGGVSLLLLCLFYNLFYDSTGHSFWFYSGLLYTLP